MSDPATEPDGAIAPAAAAAQPRLRRVIGHFTAVNAAVVVAGMVTGPLQARALGPSGRGDLAAIMAPLGIAPTLLSLGLGTFAIREVAKGRDLGALLATIGALMLALSIPGVALGESLAHVLADGRPTVLLFLQIGFAMVPLSLIGLLLLGLAIGLEEWRSVIAVRVATALALLVPIVVLFVVGRLDVTSAAIVSFGGGLAVLLPVVAVLRRRPRLRFDRALVRPAFRFGIPAWLGGLSSIANSRLDQLLMIRLVAPEQLGLYAVAVTFSNFLIAPLITAVTTAMLPRVSRGDALLAQRATRTVLVATAVAAVAVAIASLPVLALLYGHAFVPAWPLTLVLLVGSMPLALNNLLSASVSFAGHPRVAATAEIAALAVTIGGLLLLLGPLDAMGAAVTSVVAYSTTTAYLLENCRKHLGGRRRDYLVPHRDDYREGWELVMSRVRPALAWIGRRRGTS